VTDDRCWLRVNWLFVNGHLVSGRLSTEVVTQQKCSMIGRVIC
jgi:hypothetical protein